MRSMLYVATPTDYSSRSTVRLQSTKRICERFRVVAMERTHSHHVH
eukprot:SAG11_NODE_38278_length_253_cov_0.655844_1_plen_45_part_01